MAPVNRIRIVLSALSLLASLLAADVHAGLVHDPWLARLQVGQMRDPAAHAVDGGGWPGGLLAPLSVDPGFLQGARSYFAQDDLPRRHDLVAWRLALPLLGGVEAADAAHAVARDQARQLISLSAGAAAPLATTLPPVRGPSRSISSRRAGSGRATSGARRPPPARPC